MPPVLVVGEGVSWWSFCGVLGPVAGEFPADEAGPAMELLRIAGESVEVLLKNGGRRLIRRRG